MKFIHTADLHLGSPFKGLTYLPAAIKESVVNSIYQTFDQLVADAINFAVDFIIIAGDLFDNVQRNLHAQLYLQAKFKQLAQKNIRVLIVFGNHDYWTPSKAVITYPNNVFVFGPEITTITWDLGLNQRIAISGFSYDKNHIYQDMAQNFPRRLSNVDYQIGILHGQLGVAQQNPYAPFTLQDLQNKGYDYWALGHIHQQQILCKNPYIIYPGNLQGRQQQESGAKGYYLVEWDGQTTTVEFRPIARIIWHNCRLDVQNVTNLDELLTQIKQKIANKNNSLLTLTLENFECLDPDLQKLVNSGELLASLQQQITSDHFNYIYRLVPQINSQTIYQSLDEVFWQQAAQEIFTADNIADKLGKLQQVTPIKDLLQEEDFLNKLKQDVLKTMSQNKMED